MEVVPVAPPSPRPAAGRPFLSPSLTRPHFVAESAAFAGALAKLQRFARHPDATVLLEGESGTGKSYFARRLHLASPRAAGPFREVSLAAVEDALAGSELFGHVRGAFTDAREARHGHFASAAGGTLFLDEIGKASAAVQRKLLRVVETREFYALGADRPATTDVRLVTATNVPLEELAGRGDFLADLVPRLDVFRVRIPALRERREDVPGLVRQFVAAHARKCGYREVPDVDDRLLEALVAAEWPYNLRQLDGTVQRLLLEAEGAPVLRPGHCRDELSYLAREARAAGDTPRAVTPAVVADALGEVGSKTAAAAALGVSRSTLYRRLRQAGCAGPGRGPVADDVSLAATTHRPAAVRAG